MKILFLSTATGQGHNSASYAAAHYLQSVGCEAVVSDVLKAGKKNVSAPVSHAYERITVHLPWLFGFLYHLGELVTSDKHHSPIYYLNALYAKKLYAKLTALAPDVIACPQIFAAQAVTRLREKYGYAVPAAGIITDYNRSPFWEETRLDYYLIPTPELIPALAASGIPAEKLIVTGIPVDARFQKKTPRDEARRTFGLTAKHVCAVMGGSMGFGKIRETARALLERMPETQVVAVCGHNRRLYEHLQGMAGILPMEYIDNVDVLMDAADVLLTKPGGLSSTEAMVKGVPLVFMEPLPGDERKNAALLCRLGAALPGFTASAAAEAAATLVNDPEKRNAMLAAQRRSIPRDADRRTGNFLLQLARGEAEAAAARLTGATPDGIGS